MNIERMPQKIMTIKMEGTRKRRRLHKRWGWRGFEDHGKKKFACIG
jgi:hypothetical protein